MKDFIIKLFLILLLYRYYSIIKINNGNKNISACLCVIGKNEILYATEYVNYYKKLGFDHIYIYDNNNVNEEKFNDVIYQYINTNFVTIINIRGMIEPQCFAYFDCYKKNNKKYDWLAFFDFDEFLELPHDKNIKKFLSNTKYTKCVSIKINFLFFSDNELLYYDNRTLRERFTQPLYNHSSNYFTKVIVRGKLKSNYWSYNCNPHTSHFKCISCDSMGKKVNYKTKIVKPAYYELAYLKHYYTKSTEEYFIKSYRGNAFAKVYWNNKRKMIKIRDYFLYNKKTESKIKLLMKLFNLTNNEIKKFYV